MPRRSAASGIALILITLCLTVVSPGPGEAREELPPLLLYEDGVIGGVVSDSISSEPIQRASVICAGRGIVTDRDGRFVLRDVPGGIASLQIRHVAYEPLTLDVLVTAGDTTWVVLSLVSYAHRVKEVTIESDRVIPLTSPVTTRYTLPQQIFDEVPFDNLLDAIPLLPGIIVHGERLFFRGVGFEHVLPLIDGVPARDPLKGLWIMPPPDALVAADFVAGAFSADYGQQLGGVVEMTLAKGGERPHAQFAYKTDRLRVRPEEDFMTDHVELTVSGPTVLDDVAYSVSWTGRLTDTYLVYDRYKARQNFLGEFTLGNRMQGEQTGSVKLTYEPKGKPWRTSLVAVHFGDRRNPFNHHYSKSGWVRFDWGAGGQKNYEGFVIDLPEDPWNDSRLEIYEGPDHVPTRARSSTLLISRYIRTLGNSGVLDLHTRYSHHRHETDVHGLTPDEMLFTRYNSSTLREPYFSTHGEFFEYEDGESDEGAFGAKLRWRPGGGHDLRMGGGAAFGSHRYATIQPIRPMGGPWSWLSVGSLDDRMKTVDAYAYAEDHWKSDSFTTLFLSFRGDHQRIMDYPGDASGTAVSTRLGFMHPMTDVDGIHVQAGVLYQFPTYQHHFLPNLRGEYPDLSGIALTAQRTRAVEIGMQHHFSEKIVGYISGYKRQYSNVIFARRDLGDLDFIIGFVGGNVRDVGDPFGVDALGLEATVDVRPVRWLGGTAQRHDVPHRGRGHGDAMGPEPRRARLASCESAKGFQRGHELAMAHRRAVRARARSERDRRHGPGPSAESANRERERILHTGRRPRSVSCLCRHPKPARSPRSAVQLHDVSGDERVRLAFPPVLSPNG